MSKRNPKNRIKHARKKMEEFSARGSLCPICKASFRRGCSHSVKQAEDRLFENYINAIIDKRLNDLLDDDK